MKNKDHIRERLVECLKNSGIDPENMDEKIEIDSLAFITTVIEIESEFEIEFPDTVLTANIFESYIALEDMVTELVHCD